MSLSECFERLDPETWAKNLGINRLLFGPKEDIADPKAAGYAWLRNILGVNSGRISFRFLLEDSVQKGKFTEALDISEYCAEGEQPALKDKILKHLNQNHKDTLKRIENLNDRILAVEERIISNIGKDFLDELKGKLQRIKRWEFPLMLSFEGLELYELFVKDVNELEETVILLEWEDQTSLKELFQIFSRLIENIKTVFLGEKKFPKELIEKYFLSLPALVLRGKREILWKISNALDSDDIEALIAIEVPKDFFPIGRAGYEKFEIRPKVKSKQISPVALRVVTKTLLDDIPKLEEKFESSQMARAFVENQTRRAKTCQEAAKILIGGAKAISLMGDSDVFDLQARGLMELAEHHLSIRNYTYAFELYIDAFRTWIVLRSETGVLSTEERKAASGVLLAVWAPKVMSRQEYKNIGEIVEFFLEDPTAMLEKIAAENEIEIVYHSFQQLGELEALRYFARYLEETWPKVDWAIILSERVLQPRLFFQNPAKRLVELRALIEDRFAEGGMKEIIDAFAATIDATTLGDKASAIELEELNRKVEMFRTRVDESPSSESPGLRGLLEGLDITVKSLKGKIQPADEIQFTVRPLNNLFYLGERDIGLELIFAVTLTDNSLPAKALQAQIRIEPRQKDIVSNFIKFRSSQIYLGPLSPSSTAEIVFNVDVEKNILKQYSEISVEMNFLDGINVITPIDKKHIFQIFLRNVRKGSKDNPYVAGPAIEKGSLYVGREQELKQIKSALIGQSQDSIPLILGIRRIGKTSLLKRLMEDQDIKRNYVPVFLDLQDMAESDTTADFLKHICAKIHEKCGERWKLPFSRMSFESQDPFEVFEKYMLNSSSAPGTLRILLIIDEFEKLVSNLNKWIVRIRESGKPGDPRGALVPEVFGALRKAMLHATRISFIVAGTPQIKSSLQDYESRWFGLMTPLILKPLDEDEAKKLILPEMIPYKVGSEAVDEVIYMTGRQPYLIQLVCKHLFNFMLDTGRETAAKKDIERIIAREILPFEAYFADYKRLVGEDGNILRAISLVHKRLGGRRRFVSAYEISEALARSGKTLSKELLVERLREMESAERPLVQRSPSRSDAFRIVIGMVGKLLEEGSGV